MVRLLIAAVCAAGLLTTPALAPAAKAQTDKAVVKSEKPLTANQIAARKRQTQCAAEWKGAKAAGKTENGMTWPKYWSACNTRLKAGG